MQTPGSVTHEPFGTTPEGETVEIFTLTNASGMQVRAISFGGIIQSIRVPDRSGVAADVVLGFETLSDYVQDHPYFGAIIGRYGNRIGGARFEIDGRVYPLAANNGPNHLHGGIRGFDKVVWDVLPFENEREVGLVFSRVSPDGEEGYPGGVTVQVTYTLTDDDALVVDYHATTDAPTHVNLTQHSYFNLAGRGDVLDHELMINADAITAVDEELIPTGELRPVEGTAFDFRKSTRIGARIEDASDPQLAYAGGYDHNFVLRTEAAGADSLVHAARAIEPETGRVLDVYTTEPGMQFYSGNFLDGSLTGKEGRRYDFRTGFCLETQHFPDTPNRPEFPSTLLRPGEAYQSQTVFKFSVID